MAGMLFGRCQAPFRPTPEVVSAFASAWRELSISVHWDTRGHFSWLATGKLSSQLLWRTRATRAQRMALVLAYKAGNVWYCKRRLDVPNDWGRCAAYGWSWRASSPLLQVSAICLRPEAPHKGQHIDNFAHDLRHGFSAGPAQPRRDGAKKKALQVSTGLAGTLTR